MHGRINAAGAWMRWSGRKLATQSAEQPVGPEGRALKRTVAALHFLLRTKAITCEVRLALVRFRSRRDRMPLIRGALAPADSSNLPRGFSWIIDNLEKIFDKTQ